MRKKISIKSRSAKLASVALLTNALFTLVLLVFGEEISQLYSEFGITSPRTFLLGYFAAAFSVLLTIFLLVNKPPKIEKWLLELENIQLLMLYLAIGFLNFLLLVFLPLYLPLYNLAGLV